MVEKGVVEVKYLPYCVVLFVFVCDQMVKWLVLDVIVMVTHPPIEVTPFFNLVMVWNHGVSFGMFSHVDARFPLIALALVVSICLLRWNRQNHSRWQNIATGMIVGGAIGNIVDRIRFGAVADFLDVHLMGYHWPSFNVADACIVIGVGLLLFYELKYSQKQKASGK